jgi:hypothetical protein
MKIQLKKGGEKGMANQSICTKVNGEIPFLIIRPTVAKLNKPVCFLYHGWGSSKEHMKFFGEILAYNGYS